MGQKAIIGAVERFALPRGPNTVRCDAPGCDAETYVERAWQWGEAEKAQARAEAAAKGWTFVDGLDLCPDHSGPAE